MASKGIATAAPAPIPSPTKLLNVEEAAEYLGATVWFVRTLAWNHKVTYVRFGKRLMFDVRDLDAFIAKNKVVAQ